MNRPASELIARGSVDVSTPAASRTSAATCPRPESSTIAHAPPAAPAAIGSQSGRRSLNARRAAPDAGIQHARHDQRHDEEQPSPQRPGSRLARVVAPPSLGQERCERRALAVLEADVGVRRPVLSPAPGQHVDLLGRDPSAHGADERAKDLVARALPWLVADPVDDEHADVGGRLIFRSGHTLHEARASQEIRRRGRAGGGQPSGNSNIRASAVPTRSRTTRAERWTWARMNAAAASASPARTQRMISRCSAIVAPMRSSVVKS
jgi:hypothetical protein